MTSATMHLLESYKDCNDCTDSMAHRQVSGSVHYLEKWDVRQALSIWINLGRKSLPWNEEYFGCSRVDTASCIGNERRR